MKQVMHEIWNAMEMRNTSSLKDALGGIDLKELYLDPCDKDIPDRSKAGSISGLIASIRWHDGMEVLIESKVNLTKNGMVRNPLLWAWANDDHDMVELLLRGGYDPLWWFLDTRPGQPGRAWERFGPLWATKMRVSEDYGTLDEVCVKSYLTSQPKNPIIVRPSIATCMLTKPRQNSSIILQSLLKLESVQKSDDVKHYARYLLGRLKFKPDVLLEWVIREQLGVTEPLDMPTDFTQTGSFNILK